MNIFNNMGITYIDTATRAISGFGWQYRPKPEIHFYAPTPYKSVYLERLKFTTRKATMEAAWQLYAEALKRIRGTQTASLKAQHEIRNEYLVQHAQMNPRIKEQEYGVIPLTDSGGKSAYAKDLLGRIVRESLILHYDTDEIRQVYVQTTRTSPTSGMSTMESYSTRTIWVADCCPEVSVSSGKNIVMTKVTGRDYSRKEIVAGDDLSFTVSGKLICHTMPVEDENGDTYIQYPEDEVRRFIQIMQHPGIIKVNHFLFSQFNVDKVIIKDYSLDHPTYKNEQPYRFTCVAVEPDEDVVVTQDTISILDDEVQAASGNGIYDVLMRYKLGRLIAGNQVGRTVTEKTVEAIKDTATGLLNWGIDSIPV